MQEERWSWAAAVLLTAETKPLCAAPARPRTRDAGLEISIAALQTRPLLLPWKAAPPLAIQLHPALYCTLLAATMLPQCLLQGVGYLKDRWGDEFVAYSY